MASEPVPLSLEPAGVKVVSLNEEDLEEVLAIEKLSFPHPWSKYAFRQELRNRFSRLFGLKILEEGKELLAGYVCFWQVNDEVHITNIAIHPDYRGQRLGTQLLSFVQGVAEENKTRQITLEVRRSNTAAINLYLRKGFEVTAVRKAYYYEEREDALVMCLKLGAWQENAPG